MAQGEGGQLQIKIKFFPYWHPFAFFKYHFKVTVNLSGPHFVKKKIAHILQLKHLPVVC